MNDLLKTVHNNQMIPLAYADDLVWICYGKNPLRKCIQLINQWCQVNNMELNKKKSGIIHLKRGTSKKQEKDIYGIAVVKDYKYLGVNLNEAISAKN